MSKGNGSLFGVARAHARVNKVSRFLRKRYDKKMKRLGLSGSKGFNDGCDTQKQRIIILAILVICVVVMRMVLQPVSLLALLPVQGQSCNELQQIKLVAGDAYGSDQFGGSVSLSGSTIVVGSRYDADAGSNSGSAYVFQESSLGQGDFVEVIKLVADDAYANDHFGGSVSVSGSTIVVGSPYNDDTGANSGSAYVFQESSFGAGFVQVIKLVADDAYAGDRFGDSVSVSGSTIVVVSRYDDDAGSSNYVESGSAYVFQESSLLQGDFVQVIKLVANDAAGGDYFGYSVSVSGSTIVVGSYQDDNADVESGSAYVFQESSLLQGDFVQVIKLVAGDAAASDWFGYSVSVSGSTIVVGSYNDDDAGSSSGSAYVFQESSLLQGDFVQVIKLVAGDAASQDYFGQSVSLSGSTIVVGSRFDSNSGSAYVFQESSLLQGDFVEVIKLVAGDAAQWDYFGWSVSLSGSTIVVGSRYDSDAGSNSGSAYVFHLDCFDDCASSPCSNDGTCSESSDSYECNCTTLFTGDMCETCLCLNGGVCDAMSCECSFTDYTGTLCETKIDDCLSSPCLVGVCTDEFLGFSCDCDGTGATGPKCETDIDDCTSSPCSNEALCIDLGANHFACNCSGTGQSGVLCEDDANDCLSSPCHNNGACLDTGANTFTCDCSGTGYEGDLCMNDIDDCLSSPCHNNGACLDTGANIFTCNCSGTGYEGDLCHADIDDCVSSPCANGAACQDAGVSLVTCNCTMGFEGSFCELDSNDCLSAPCQNDGVCTDIGANVFECECSSTHTGAMCETELDLGPSEYSPVTIVMTFAGFAKNNDTAESFANELKQTLLPAALGGGPSDYEVTVLEQGDGSYEYTIETVNRYGYDYSEIEQRIVDYDEIGNRVTGTIRVRQVVEESSAYHLHGSIAMTVIVMWSAMFCM